MQTEKQRMNPYKLFVGVFIPEALVSYDKISAGAKLCYGKLCQYSGKKGYAFPRQTTLAKELGVGSSRQAGRYINELVDAKLIESERCGPRTNRYFFLRHDIFDVFDQTHMSGVDQTHMSGLLYKEGKESEEKNQRIGDTAVAGGVDKSKVNEFIGLFDHNPNCKALFKNKTERKAAEQLIEIHPWDDLLLYVKAVKKVIGEKYAPQIYTPNQLLIKLPNLEAYFEKED